MSRPVLFLVTLLVAVGAVQAVPRWYAPALLKPGTVNELYAWDEGPLPSFSVVVFREAVDRPLATARGFTVDLPLPGVDPRIPEFRWSAALVSPDAFEASGPVTIRFLDETGGTLAEFSSVIQAREYPVESIPLDQTMSQLRKSPDARKDREAEAIWKVYQSFDSKFTRPRGRFVLPVATFFPLSARFGDTRKFEYADGTISQDYHRGTDFAVPVGTPVCAPAPGTVVLVADRMLTGTTVVVEHGPGIYSVYFHLSRAVVKKGQRVSVGDRVAFSGATGLVTGPHLHWEVRINGVPVDPLGLVTTALLDTGAVGAVISSIERPIH